MRGIFSRGRSGPKIKKVDEQHALATWRLEVKVLEVDNKESSYSLNLTGITSGEDGYTERYKVRDKEKRLVIDTAVKRANKNAENKMEFDGAEYGYGFGTRIIVTGYKEPKKS